MARGDNIDILGVNGDESPDTDGDGGGDRQERLESTDLSDDRPTLNAALTGDDPRGDLENVTLERETVFDPNASMPVGMNVDTVLVGMTDLDGNSIQMGPNRHGVGEDSILGEHNLGESPLGVSRNPFDTATGGNAPTWVGEGHKDRPPGFIDPKTLVSAETYGTGPYTGATARLMQLENDMKSETKVRETKAPKEPATPPPPGQTPRMDDGSGEDLLRLPTAQEVEQALAAKGGGTVSRPVEGGNDGPQIGSNDPPPENPRYRGVTDPIDEAGTQTGIPDATVLAGGAPAAPVIHTMNPDAGVDQPRQTSNSGQGGSRDPIVNGGGQGLTADIVAPGMSAPGITEVGSGNGPSSIQSVDASADAAGTSATEFLADGSTDRGIIIPDTDRGIIIPDTDRGIIIPDTDRGIIIPDFGLEGDPTATVASFDSLEPVDFAAKGAEMLDAEQEAGRDCFDPSDG